MNRRDFILKGSAVAFSAAGTSALNATQQIASNDNFKGTIARIRPRAITMWDFSWLERRWDGAGFEDWDSVLDELVVRGYNAVRIDAYPHLVAAGATKKWTLNEVWNQQMWGSPDLNIVQVQPMLNQFLEKCRERDIKVGLSSWYRQDTEGTVMKIDSPEKMADNWLKTLKTIEEGGLLDTVLYVDLCNEWPGNIWAPYFEKLHPDVYWGQWHKEASWKWIKTALSMMKEAYPDIPFLFSFDNADVEKYEEMSAKDYLDLFEHHIWMVQQNGNEFYKEVDYRDGRFSPEAYKKVVRKAEPLYREKPEYWQKLLTDKIELIADIAKKLKRPLATTECWGIVDYKDWPLLGWDWVKELCEIGTIKASQTGAWGAIATSNFCAPQFVGMWRDIKWHQRMTRIIKDSVIDESILSDPIAQKFLRRL